MPSTYDDARILTPCYLPYCTPDSVAIKMVVKRKSLSKAKHEFAVCQFGGPGNSLVLLQQSPGETMWPFVSSFDDFARILDTFLPSDGHDGDTSQAVLSPPPVRDISKIMAQVELILHGPGAKREGASAHTYKCQRENRYDQYVTRVILVYGDSFGEPPIISSPVPDLISRSDFYLDVMYVHVKLTSERARCQEIFEGLSQVEAHQPSKNIYLLETNHSSIKLFALSAALIAHAVQREAQNDFLSKLDITPDFREALSS
jgi:hypothetical protein